MKLETRKKFDRMCDYYNLEESCTNCPIFHSQFYSCDEFIEGNSEVAEQIIETWNKEHPAYNKEELEKFFKRNNIPYIYTSYEGYNIDPDWLKEENRNKFIT